MENTNTYIILKNLEVYQLSRELSKLAWKIYEPLDWHIKKINGDQFIESTDSTGANIAEGYGRFHYLDKIKFFYNCRGSLMECAQHWIELLFEKNKSPKKIMKSLRKLAKIFTKA
ncbi:MAG: four helix bundle protein [Patescibacteria group bacterium]|nr:four helix bundle protein [Patescibacteria group bacterium]